MFRGEIVKLLDHWSLLPRDQAVTELYFADAEALPRTYIPGEKINVKFTIVNARDQTRTYDYVISQSDSATGVARLYGSSETLGSNESRTIEQEVTPIDHGDRTQITVSLKGLPQKISFWLTK